MSLIRRYLFRQLLIPAALALTALTTVAFLSQSLSALDLIVDQRQNFLVFLTVTLLALPQLISLILPIALFVAALVALNRLHTEQEIVVCFAGGMSRWEVISPAMRLAAGAVLISLALNLWIAPLCSRALRNEIFKARTDFASSMVRPGEFTEPAPGLTVYALSATPDGAMKNMFVHQQRGAASTTFNARSGQIAKRGGAPILIMRHGSSQSFNAAGVLNFLSFDEYTLDLSPYLTHDNAVRFKTSDRYLHELVFPDLTQASEKAYRLKMLSEANSRLASPLYSLALMAIALAAVIGGQFSRLGYANRISAAAGAAAAVRIIGFSVQALAVHSAWLNGLQYVVPLAACAVALGQVFQARVGRTPLPGRRTPGSLAGARA